MKFKQGDKVAFLNENQNGIVKKTIGTNKVVVEIEDGFEIEVFESELIISQISVDPTPVEKEIETTEQISSESPNDLCQSDCIVFVALPSNPQAVLTGTINYFIVNKTEYSLAITCNAMHGNSGNGIYTGILKPAENVLVTTLKREELTEISAIRFEALLFNKNKLPDINHIRKEIPLLIPDIRSSFRNIRGENSFAKTFDLFSTKAPEPFLIKDLVEKFNTKSEPGIVEKTESGYQKSKKQQFDYGVHYNEKVVDLHIEELTNDISKLTNSEMLLIQLKKFNVEMDNALRSHYRRIIFIHGIGNGTLKRAIREELKVYSNIQVKDADQSKYGSGATEVIF